MMTVVEAVRQSKRGWSERVVDMIRDLADRLEYADDAALVDEIAVDATARVSKLCDYALAKADMEISAPKTKCMQTV